MNKNKVFLIFALSNLASANFIDGEINLGTKVSFGVEGFAPFTDQIKPILKLVIPRKKEDYHINFKENPSNYDGEEDDSVYVPNIKPAQRDFDLAVRYLSDTIRLKNYANIKLRENLIGLGLNIDLETKEKNYSNLVDDFKLENANISVLSNNKYLNGYVKYSLKGKEEKQNIFEKEIDGDKKLNTKDVEYDLSANSYLENLKLSLNISGKNKKYKLVPSVTYFDNGMYFGGGVILDSNPAFDLENEYSKVKYSAPGYSKIEYFKKFKKIDKEIKTLNDYHNDLIDLNNATISGYKGTWRLEGLPSGSLYGDNPIKFVANEIIDEIYDNSKFKNTASFLNRLENDKNEIGIIEGIGLAVNKDKILGEVGNKDNINELISNVSKKILDRVKFKDDILKSKYGVYRQIPDEFKILIPYLNKDFDYTKIEPAKLDPNYLYNKGFNKELPRRSYSNPGNPNDKLVFSNLYRNVDVDFNRYFVKELMYHNPLIKNVVEANVAALGFDFVLNQEFTANVRSLLERPENIKGMDLLRGIYFHSSEKNINEKKLEDKILTSISNVDFSEFKNKSNNFSLALNFGMNNKKYNLDLSANLFNIKRYENGNDKVFKHTNTFGLNYGINREKIDFSTKNLFIYDNFVSKINNDEISFDSLELITSNDITYKFKAHKDVNVGLGLKHIGHYGYIIPRKLSFNGKKYSEKVAKRDSSNNPISLDGESIIVKNETENTLTEKALKHKLNNGKNIRKVTPKDYILTGDKEAQSNWYKVDSLLIPTVDVDYNIDDNLIITNTFKLPLRFNRRTLNSIGFSSNTNLKFLFSEKNLRPLISKENLLKFKYSVNADLGLSLVKPEFIKNYDIKAGLGFLDARLKSRGEDIPDFKLSLNPLLVDFKLNPSLGIFENRKDIYAGMGLKFVSENNYFDFELGAARIIVPKKKLIEKELLPQIKYLLKTRNEKEYNKFNEAIEEFKVKDDLRYEIMPYANLNYDKDNLKFSLSYVSKKGTISNNSEEILPEVIVKQPLEELGTTFIAWDYYRYLSGKYIYIVPRKEKHTQISKKSSYHIENQNYNLKFDFSYNKNDALDINGSMLFNLSNNSYSSKKQEITRVRDYTNLYMVYIQRGEKHKDRENEFVDKNKLDRFTDRNEAETHLDSKLREKHGRVSSDLATGSFGYTGNGQKATLDEMLKPSYTETTNVKEESENLNNKKIDFNLNLSMGYNFKVGENVTMGAYLDNKFNLTHNILEYINVNGFSAYGEQRVEIVDNLRPLAKLKYKYNDNIKFNFDFGMDFEFNKKGYNKAMPHLLVGTNLIW